MMKIGTIIQIFLFCFFAQSLAAQNTVGVIEFDPGLVQHGYNLFFPHGQTDVYLIDNCGKIVNKWEGTHRPGNSVYLKEDGNLVRTGSNGSASNQWIHAGGGGEFIEERDWDNNPIWRYTYNDSLKRMHHDMTLLPNGNVLFIAWERKTAAEAIAEGRDPNLLPDGEVWPDKIVEIQPSMDTAMIVWEWNSWDHLVQEFDNTKSNYGVIADHSELININYDDGAGEQDWHHVNSIDYNADLDQIVISVPAFNEFWIIDHSTTTAEAATSSGGNSGKGGDLLYRWGNPEAYGQGTTADQKLFFQHDVHWIDGYGIDTQDSDYGKIMLFNNRAGADYSSVNKIATPVDAMGQYTYTAGTAYGPTDFDFTYVDSPPTNMYSTGLSGAQQLPNGNLLVCSGRQGRANEITPAGNVIWSYINPIIQGTVYAQGDVVLPNTNFVFRFIRYPFDYPAFVGKTLTPGNFIEMNPNPTLCDQALANEDFKLNTNVTVYPNPASKSVVIDYLEGKNVSLQLYNTLGQSVFQRQVNNFPLEVDLSMLNGGIYLISLDNLFAGKLVVEK